MSLAFLAKKSWHTANLRNVEKVWIAEQKHEAEEKKLAELRKNIEEERQLQELRQLQAANGNKSAALERVDWLYEGPMAQSGNTADEYLLGKEYKPDTTNSDLKKLGDSKYGSLALTKSALPANDAFSRLNEDPMMLIRKRQQAAHENILKNPVKMGKIKANVDKILSEKKMKMKAKKEAKKEKKRAKGEKKRKRDLSMSSDDGERGSEKQERSHDRSRSRTRDFSPTSRHRDEDHKRVKGSSRDRDRRYSPEHRRDRSMPRSSRADERSRGRSRSRSQTRRRSKENEGRGRSRSASVDRNSHSYRDSDRGGRRLFPDRRSRSPDRSHRSRTDKMDEYGRSAHSSKRHHSRDGRHDRRSSFDRQGSRDRGRGGRSASLETKERLRDQSRNDRRNRSPCVDGRRRSRSPAKREGARDEDRSGQRSERRDSKGRSTRPRKSGSNERKKPSDGGKYGLINREGAMECKDIDKSTLGPNTKYLEAAREKRRKEEEERKQKLSKSSRGATQYTDEEKKQMAAQMMEDARRREELFEKQASKRNKDVDDDELKESKNPHFLKEMQDAAYLGGDGEMSDRIRRNKHYVQKRADASNFMSK